MDIVQVCRSKDMILPCYQLNIDIVYVVGIKEYLLLGIPYEQLVIGVPWYGYLYTCLNITGVSSLLLKGAVMAVIVW